MMTMNAMHNCKNEYQGAAKRILCVCSAGLLRSPTTAEVLAREPFEFNTRAAGLDEEWAVIPVTKLLLHWADEVVCMTQEQGDALSILTNKPVYVLNIADSYAFRSPELIERITSCAEAIWGEELSLP